MFQCLFRSEKVLIVEISEFQLICKLLKRECAFLVTVKEISDTVIGDGPGDNVVIVLESA